MGCGNREGQCRNLTLPHPSFAVQDPARRGSGIKGSCVDPAASGGTTVLGKLSEAKCNQNEKKKKNLTNTAERRRAERVGKGEPKVPCSLTKLPEPRWPTGSPTPPHRVAPTRKHPRDASGRGPAVPTKFLQERVSRESRRQRDGS